MFVELLSVSKTEFEMKKKMLIDHNFKVVSIDIDVDSYRGLFEYGGLPNNTTFPIVQPTNSPAF